MKKVIRLTESDLSRIVKESVKRILREGKYDLPTGGFNSSAYSYDQALETASSLEDWDNMMAVRKKFNDVSADNAQYYHPQRDCKWNPGGVGGHKYVRPDDYGKENDNILHDIEDTADFARKKHGFPY
jgi:hypothetical protein